jgi:hypothetical protein
MAMLNYHQTCPVASVGFVPREPHFSVAHFPTWQGIEISPSRKYLRLIAESRLEEFFENNWRELKKIVASAV